MNKMRGKVNPKLKTPNELTVREFYETKKLKIYLDTSVLNFYITPQDIEKQEITKTFFKKINAEFYISELVVEEANRSKEPKRTELIELIKKINPIVLTYSEEIDSLASLYVMEGIIPKEYLPDAYHVAFTSVYEIDILVSWNLEHMVKVKTRRMVSSVNLRLGYKIIEISTPGEAI